MKLLLDTHPAIWWRRSPERLSAAARSAIEDGESQVLVSAISALEIAIKHRIGKLPELENPMTNYLRLMTANRFESLAVTSDHSLRAGMMPKDHRDPFDRVIAAQGIIEDAAIVTCVAAFATFGCRTLW